MTTQQRTLVCGGGGKTFFSLVLSVLPGCLARKLLTASRRSRAICGPVCRKCSRSCRLRGTRGRCVPPCRSCSKSVGSGQNRRRLRLPCDLAGLRAYRRHRGLHRRGSQTHLHHRRSGTSCRTTILRHSRGLPAGTRGRSGRACGRRSTPGCSC